MVSIINNILISSGLGTCVSTEKATFDAWERYTAEMAGLETAFPCVSTHFNPCHAANSLGDLSNYLVSASVDSGIQPMKFDKYSHHNTILVNGMV